MAHPTALNQRTKDNERRFQMAIRSRSRSARGATPPVGAAVADDGSSGESISVNASGVVGGNDAASEALPDIKLYGETVPILSREARIAIAAYERAERRGFEPGYDLEDWFAAEREVDAAAFGESVGGNAIDDAAAMGQ
jgi:hypothetical protein